MIIRAARNYNHDYYGQYLGPKYLIPLLIDFAFTGKKMILLTVDTSSERQIIIIINECIESRTAKRKLLEAEIVIDIKM